ncbi:hypothetical protein C7271_10185 [filamentous cyanobacterium CCP5]|nr:hypothetical protein C7271_10185 [filamentous cyanobacterium CCP5]
MRSIIGLLSAGVVLAGSFGFANASYGEVVVAPPSSAALEIQSTQVHYIDDLDLLVFEQQLAGDVGATLPQPAGQLDGAPVLGYVFPTTLRPEDVGFGGTEGIVALAITAHPDFDDTPLWDENNDADYANDGVVWHAHWVVLTPDERVPGGLSVAAFEPGDGTVVMPPTNPGMAIYLDSPGFAVVADQNTLRVLVPAQRVNQNLTFNFDAVTAYMEVNTSDQSRPMLGVYEVYSVGSGDLSLPYGVQRRSP